MKPNKNLHFIGIGGSGMSALAQIASAHQPVTGSDRAWPSPTPSLILQKLNRQNIQLFPQDGSGITKKTECVIYSTAIEPDNPDLLQAEKLSIQRLHRAEYLNHLVQNKKLIAIGGTSGKSTITGMLGVLLHELKLSPTIINGGEILNFDTENAIGNSKPGESELYVVESDESDGSLTRFSSYLSIISNISKDHKTLKELRSLFIQFAQQTQKVLVLNVDCPEIAAIKWPVENILTYSTVQNADFQAKDIKLSSTGSKFNVSNVEFDLQVPGEHNVSNALAAITAAAALNIPLEESAKAVQKFTGIRRRLEKVSSSNSHLVFDDFAHNPEKIQASIRAILPHAKRCLFVFQPHGFGPTRFLFNEFVNVFSKEIREKDKLYLLPIFDAGGTANRTISSEDLGKKILENKKMAQTVQNREELLECLKREIKPEDVVLVMGARDPSLTDLCHQIAAL